MGLLLLAYAACCHATGLHLHHPIVHTAWLHSIGTLLISFGYLLLLCSMWFRTCKLAELLSWVENLSPTAQCSDQSVTTTRLWFGVAARPSPGSLWGSPICLLPGEPACMTRSSGSQLSSRGHDALTSSLSSLALRRVAGFMSYKDWRQALREPSIVAARKPATAASSCRSSSACSSAALQLGLLEWLRSFCRSHHRDVR